MTVEYAIRRLKVRDVHGNMTGYTGGQSDVLDFCLKALETLSAIDSIINREDSLIGRVQEDVIRYQMICKVMQTWKAGEKE